jgi:hypothetical protein
MANPLKQLGRKNAQLLIGATLFAAAVMVGVPTPASAANNYGYGQLISKNSLPGQQMCLTNYGSRSEGFTVYQYPYSNASRQLWRMQPIGGGYFKIISGFNDKTSLEVLDSSHNNHATVTTWQCMPGASNQEWSTGQSLDGFTLKPRHSKFDNAGRGKCLDVFAYSHSNVAPVVQWDCLGGVNQLWSYDLW